MAIYDKASLVLIPSGTKTSKVYSQVPVSGDGDFTFSRSTAATRVNADGNIEKETQNLLLQSNQFDTTWGNSSSTETGGQSGYDGSNDAWRIDKTASGGYLVQNIGTSGVQTFSVYAKAGTTDWMQLLTLGSGTGSRYVFYDLTNGVIGSQSGSGTYGIDSNIESVGGGWYRCSLTFNTTLNDVRIYPAEANSVSAASGNIYIQDAQLEQGLVARDYIETTTTAVEGGITDNVPRLDYTDSSCPSLLLEPQRSNLLTHSEYFGGWGQINTINTANALISPEGVQNANKLIAASGVNNNVINQQISAGTYTASVFAKKGEFEGLFIGSGPTGAFFNLNTYAYRTHYQSAPTSYKIEDYGNGWHRYSITFTISGNDSLYIGPNDNVSNTLGVTGNNSNGIYIYGATLEAATYATSYIPTYGSAVTRNQDTGSIPSASSLIGQTEGTLFVKFKYTNEAVGLVGINAGNIGNRLYIGTDTNGLISQVRVSYSTQAFFSTPLTIGTTYKCALAYKENDFVLYVNGSQIGVDTNGLVPSSLSRIAFQQANDTNSMAQPIGEMLVFKTRLSNEELADLTTL